MPQNTDCTPRGTPLALADRQRLSTLRDRVGEKATRQLVGCSREALHAALAGASIYGVTAAAIRAGLDRADAQRAAEAAAEPLSPVAVGAGR